MCVDMRSVPGLLFLNNVAHDIKGEIMAAKDVEPPLQFTYIPQQFARYLLTFGITLHVLGDPD